MKRKDRPIAIHISGRIFSGQQVVSIFLFSMRRRQTFQLEMILENTRGNPDMAGMMNQEIYNHTWRQFRDSWRKLVIGSDWRSKSVARRRRMQAVGPLPNG